MLRTMKWCELKVTGQFGPRILWTQVRSRDVKFIFFLNSNVKIRIKFELRLHTRPSVAAY